MYRQVRVLGALLILQVVGLVAIGALLISNVDWQALIDASTVQGQNVTIRSIPRSTRAELIQAILFTVFFVAPTVLLFFAGLGFVLLRRRGWLLASVAQGWILLSCIFFYPDPRPALAYPIIAYGIVMVLFLNSREVRTVVHSRGRPLGERSETPIGG